MTDCKGLKGITFNKKQAAVGAFSIMTGKSFLGYIVSGIDLGNKTTAKTVAEHFRMIRLLIFRFYKFFGT